MHEVEMQVTTAVYSTIASVWQGKLLDITTRQMEWAIMLANWLWNRCFTILSQSHHEILFYWKRDCLVLATSPQNYAVKLMWIQADSARTWKFFYRYIVPDDDRLSIKNDKLVTWLTTLPPLIDNYTGDHSGKKKRSHFENDQNHAHCRIINMILKSKMAVCLPEWDCRYINYIYYLHVEGRCAEYLPLLAYFTISDHYMWFYFWWELLCSIDNFLGYR